MTSARRVGSEATRAETDRACAACPVDPAPWTQEHEARTPWANVLSAYRTSFAHPGLSETTCAIWLLRGRQEVRTRVRVIRLDGALDRRGDAGRPRHRRPPSRDPKGGGGRTRPAWLASRCAVVHGEMARRFGEESARRARDRQTVRRTDLGVPLTARHRRLSPLTEKGRHDERIMGLAIPSPARSRWPRTTTAFASVGRKRSGEHTRLQLNDTAVPSTVPSRWNAPHRSRRTPRMPSAAGVQRPGGGSYGPKDWRGRALWPGA